MKEITQLKPEAKTKGKRITCPKCNEKGLLILRQTKSKGKNYAYLCVAHSKATKISESGKRVHKIVWHYLNKTDVEKLRKKGIIKDCENVTQNASDKENLYSLPVKEQVETVIAIPALSNLHQLRYAVQTILEPKYSYNPHIQYLFISHFFHMFKTWLLESCHKDEAKGKAVLKALNEYIDEAQTMLFESQKIVESEKEGVRT